MTSDTVNLESGGGAGRNRACPCGSEKRYKDCCGAIAARPTPGPATRGVYRAPPREWSGLSAPEVDRLGAEMEEALRLHQAGSTVAAALHYREVVRAAPLTHDALHMLGAIEYGFGRWMLADKLIREALAIRPEYPEIRRNLDLVGLAIRAGSPGDRELQAERSLAALRPLVREFDSGATDATGHATGTSSDNAIHVVGHAFDVDVDGGWLADRVAAALRDPVYAWAMSSDAIPTPRLVAGPGRLKFGQPYPTGGTLVLIGASVAIARWLGDARPRRAVIVVTRGPASTYFDAIEACSAATGMKVELVFRSVAERARYNLPGRACLPPFLTPEASATPAIECGARAFTVGSIGAVSESTDAPPLAELWLAVAASVPRLVLRGANRLRHALGMYPGIEIRSPQRESFDAFLASLDCLVYAPPSAWNEGNAVDLFAAMSLGIPVVCTAGSNFAEYIEDGRTGLVTTTTQDAVRSIDRLRSDAGLRQSIVHQARESVVALQAQGAIRERYRFLSADSMDAASAV